MPISQRLRAALAAACLVMASAAGAQEPYPSRAITIVNGFSAGGAVDTVARALAEKLSASLGQSVVVESRPGAGSNLAAATVARSPADGYTLLLGTNGLAINMALYAAPGFDVEADLAPISMVGDIPAIIAAHPSFPASSIPELIAHAKANPGAISYATPGNGSLPHLAMALLASKDKLDLRHVAYRGGHPAVTDTIGGHVPLVVVNALEAAPYILDNKLKGLGTTGPKRLQALPQLATVAEAPGLGSYAAETWWGLFAPAATPQPVLERLEREVHKALADPALRKRIEDVGGSVKPSSRAELAAFVRSERVKWKDVVQATGLKAN